MRVLFVLVCAVVYMSVLWYGEGQKVAREEKKEEERGQ